MSNLSLVPVNRTNWMTCAKLELPTEQAHFVAPNLWSIAESRFEPGYRPRAIMLDHQVIGFLMYCADHELPDPALFWIFRLMIAQPFQGHGYGRRAFELALQETIAAGAQRIRTMHKPDNIVAGALYRRLGFLPIGTDEDGDILLEKVVSH